MYMSVEGRLGCRAYVCLVIRMYVNKGVVLYVLSRLLCKASVEMVVAGCVTERALGRGTCLPFLGSGAVQRARWI